MPLDLAATYRRIPTSRFCDGCHECAIRCSGDIPLTAGEWDAVRQAIAELPASEAAGLLAQDKTREFAPGWTGSMCRLYDMRAQRCAVYTVRPLVCRLLGFVEWLPCPKGRRLPALADGVALMRRYAALGPRPLSEWIGAESSEPWKGSHNGDSRL